MRLIVAALLIMGTTAAAAQETPSRSIIRLSYIPGNFALPVLVGIEHGHFAREGLFLSILPVTEESAVMRSLAQGGTDFAIGSQSLLLSVAENKLDTKVVAMAGYARELELIVPAWDATTKSLADVKGKTLLLLNGVHNFDAVPELYRALALSKPAMRLSDVNIQFIDLVNVRPLLEPKLRPAWTQRKVGGILMFREFTSTFVDEKKARVAVSNDNLSKLIGRTGAQPLFASNLILEKDPKAAERFVRAWARTLQYMADAANKDAVVRVLQIYYLRQYGHALKKELAELYFGVTKYDRVAWTDQDTAEVNINAKALNAGRNLLFARIKDPNQRPFKDVPDVKSIVDSSIAVKVLAELEAEKKAAAEKKPAAAAPKDGDKPGAPPKN